MHDSTGPAYYRTTHFGCSNEAEYKLLCPGKRAYAMIRKAVRVADSEIFKSFTVLNILHGPVIFLAKLSILLLYL